MSWIRPMVEDLKLVLSQEEIDKLAEVSVETEDVIQKQLDSVADLFRSAYLSRGYAIDSRDHYIDAGYLIPMLNYARFQIFTRFPMTGDYALDENRKKQFETAVELLKNPYLATSKPDNQPTPGPDVPSFVSADASIRLPYQRFPAFPMSNGFWQVYEWPIAASGEVFGR